MAKHSLISSEYVSRIYFVCYIVKASIIPISNNGNNIYAFSE